MEKLRKRRAWLACLLAVLQVGVGFSYVSHPWVAVAWPLVPLVFALLGRMTGVALMPWGMAIVFGLFFTTWLASVIWCGWKASRAGEVVLAPYQRWYVYVGYAGAAYPLVGRSAGTS
jgi:hypothetical protein